MGTIMLENELATYEARLQELKKEEGKFVLIHGEDLKIFDTYEDAIKCGYEQFGLEPFLVKKIASNEPIFHFTRQIIPS